MSSILDNDTPKEIAARIKELRRDGARKYFLSFIFCEILNILSIVLCMITLNALLGGNFWNYGTEVLKFYSDNEEDRLNKVSLQGELVNPMCNVFPTEVSCNVYFGALQGEIQIENKLCMLSNNIFNQYYFFVLWFWWVILLTLSLVFLVYRLIFLMVPSFPVFVLKTSLSGKGYKLDNQDSTYFFQKQKQWDAFLLMQVTGNLNSRNTKHLLDEMINQEIRKTNHIEKGQEGLPLYETQICMD